MRTISARLQAARRAWIGHVLNAGRIGLCALAIQGSAQAAQAQDTSDQTCSIPAATAAFPKLHASVERWERTNRAQLTPDAIDALIVRYCVAARPFAVQHGHSPAQLDAAAASVVGRQLDRTLRPAASDPDLGMILGAALGYKGFGSPTPRQVGRISITYTRAVEHLEVGGRRFPRTPILISEIGMRTVVGVRQGREVCRGDVVVQSTEIATFGC